MNNWAAVLAGLLILMVLLLVVADEALMRELIRSEMLRAGAEPSGDPVERERIESGVRAGGSWARYRAILGRYHLPLAVADCPSASPSRNI